MAMKRNLLLALFLISIIVWGLVLFSAFNLDTVSATAELSGIISSDATWTQANSPYILTGNLLVKNGVTLTIQSGVLVNLNTYYMMVNGTLQVLGTAGNLTTFDDGEIIFTQYSTNWNQSTNTGCIIQDAYVNSSVTVEGSAPYLINNTITRGIKVDSGEPTISNNTITSQGIFLGLGNENASVSNNVISGCSVGIQVYVNDFCSATISGNLIVNNTIGLVSTCFFPPRSAPTEIQNNTITNNTIGIVTTTSFFESYCQILNNNIFDNTDYNFKNELPIHVNTPYNWWGTTDIQGVNQKIYDYNEDYNLGIVAYSPLLISPNINAPTYVLTSATVGGYISSSGINRLNYGDSQTFTITPDSGYHVADVFVNGSSVGAVSSYTVQDVGGVTTVSATFVADSTPTPTAAPTSQSSSNSNSNSNPTAAPTKTPSPTPVPTAAIPEFSTITLVGALLIAVTVVMLFYRRRT
ncbi:MAG: hypothetical protein NWE92_01460 [Candidatus Bathyarchaeota archaeon]|nr:hypothetical protein [Candidatus Bathyarchaeota archaeon]